MAFVPPIPRLIKSLLSGRDGGRDPLGPAGERAAGRLLKRQGYRVLSRNVRTTFGEIDLLCLAPDRQTIVAVEVKARRVGANAAGSHQPAPEASVHAGKQRKLAALLRHLAKANRWEGRPLRIDVVAVEFPEKGAAVLRHHVGAVAARA